ncbi:hypothetical protein CPB86DRAFT_798413 [Serendipita vermifera]|nr:hypothetical protein CPB86DRAFT_798413 [Serendipita vermifera]
MILSISFVLFSVAAMQVYGLSTRDEGEGSDVGLISCESTDSVLRPLYLRNTEVAQDPVLPTEGVPVDLAEDVLNESATPGHFVFRVCNSTFMQLSSSPEDIIQYGHVLASGDDSKCLSGLPGRDAPQNITIENCLESENSAQMLLFWKLTNDPSGGATLDFVGANPQNNATVSYATILAGEEGSYLPQLQFIDNGTEIETQYQFTLA